MSFLFHRMRSRINSAMIAMTMIAQNQTCEKIDSSSGGDEIPLFTITVTVDSLE